jgi:predicted  nucleic acid-binding Zn-ribbon protein
MLKRGSSKDGDIARSSRMLRRRTETAFQAHSSLQKCKEKFTKVNHELLVANQKLVDNNAKLRKKLVGIEDGKEALAIELGWIEEEKDEMADELMEVAVIQQENEATVTKLTMELERVNAVYWTVVRERDQLAVENVSLMRQISIEVRDELNK